MSSFNSCCTTYERTIERSTQRKEVSFLNACLQNQNLFYEKIVLLFRMFQNLWRPRGLSAVAVRVPMPAFTGRASGLPLVARALPFTQGTARTGLPLPSRAGRVGQTWSIVSNLSLPSRVSESSKVFSHFFNLGKPFYSERNFLVFYGPNIGHPNRLHTTKLQRRFL